MLRSSLTICSGVCQSFVTESPLLTPQRCRTLQWLDRFQRSKPIYLEYMSTMTEPAPRTRRNRQGRLYSGASENPLQSCLEVAANLMLTVVFRHWSGCGFLF